LFASAGLPAVSAMGSGGFFTLAFSGEDFGDFEGSALVGFLPS